MATHYARDLWSWPPSIPCFLHLKLIPEDSRCPTDSLVESLVDSLLMLTFISSCTGSYSGKTLANYLYAVQAWLHTLHGAPWLMKPAEIEATLDGASALTPPSSRRPKRAPITLVLISSLATKLDLSKPLDAAVFTCLTTTFLSAARLREFTLSVLKSFDPSLHVKPGDVYYEQDRTSGKRGLDLEKPRQLQASLETPRDSKDFKDSK